MPPARDLPLRAPRAPEALAKEQGPPGRVSTLPGFASGMPRPPGGSRAPLGRRAGGLDQAPARAVSPEARA